MVSGRPDCTSTAMLALFRLERMRVSAATRKAKAATAKDSHWTIPDPPLSTMTVGLGLGVMFEASCHQPLAWVAPFRSPPRLLRKPRLRAHSAARRALGRR